MKQLKKTLLFIIPSLCSGGAEKSLITLLSLLDYKKYDVDLLVFRREGLFLPNVPEKVNIIDGGEEYALFDGPASAYIKNSLKFMNISKAVNRIKYSKAVSGGNRKATWKFLKKALPRIDKAYDAAIGYLEGNAIYYCVDCVKAKTKIGYIHSDYSKLELDKNFDKSFFKELDYLVGVSEKCSEVLKNIFPENLEKIKTVENITSPSILQKLSANSVSEYEEFETKILLTVGRISKPKGYDIAVDAAEILAKKNIDFKWYSIGKGELQAEIQEKIKEKNLQDKIVLLGERSNPYPYINGCDVYIQPSYYEGKSIAIDEAKCFAKPIVATKFTTVLDQLTDGKTALLAEINAESVAEKIEELLSDEELQKALSENLKKEKVGNEEEINKFYEMLEG